MEEKIVTIIWDSNEMLIYTMFEVEFCRACKIKEVPSGRLTYFKPVWSGPFSSPFLPVALSLSLSLSLAGTEVLNLK